MTKVVRVGLINLIVKGELGSGPSVADSELKAPNSGLRSREESKCGRTAGEIGSAEAKEKKGLRVEREEKKSLREGTLLDRTARDIASLLVDSKGVLSAFIGVSSGTAIDISRLGSKGARAEKTMRAVGKVRAIAIVGTMGEEGVGFLRTKNKEKGAIEEGGRSSTKRVLFHKLVSSKVIRLSASVSRSIWVIIESSG